MRAISGFGVWAVTLLLLGACNGSSAVPSADSGGPPCEPTSCNTTCVSNGFSSGRCVGTCFCDNTDNPNGCEQTPPIGCYGGQQETFSVGQCRGGSQIKYIIRDEPPVAGPCQGQVTPLDEVCNGLDDNCNGQIDEGLDCSDPLDPECSPSKPCSTGQCAEVGVLDARCVTPDPCDPISNNGCTAPQTECEAFGTVTKCWEPPQTTCVGHYWYMSVRESNNQGTHLDTGMNCIPEIDYQNGSKCAVSENDDDVQIRCEHAVSVAPRRLEGWSQDFLALDFPLHAPAGLTRCLVAWGVHPLIERSKGQSPGGRQLSVITAYIGGGASANTPVTAGGLTTTLPAAAFQHVLVERPPQTTVAEPTSKVERGARIFWNDPSVATLKDQPLHAPYAGCSNCTTYKDVIEHVYPGPEIFLQGLPRDPADSQFVIPFWMPHYDTALETQNHAILSEMVCLGLDGEVHRTVSAFGMIYENSAVQPSPDTQTYAPFSSQTCEPKKTPVIL